MGEQQDVLDCIGIPEYFSTHVGTIEDAGCGLIRIVRCIERNGVVIPVFSCVTPALNMIKDGPRFREMALRVARQGNGLMN